jgi:hypothetical protein
MNRSIKLAGLVAGVSIAAVVAGALVGTAYLDGRTVHLGQTTFALPASDGPVWDVVRAGTGGALMLHSPNDSGKGVLTAWSGRSRGESTAVKELPTMPSWSSLRSADVSWSTWSKDPRVGGPC